MVAVGVHAQRLRLEAPAAEGLALGVVHCAADDREHGGAGGPAPAVADDGVLAVLRVDALQLVGHEGQCLIPADALPLVLAAQLAVDGITFEIYSGTLADLMDNFVRGFYDFLLECELRSHVDMHTLRLPHTDTWGLLVRRDNPLAAKAAVMPEDLLDQPLISSRQGVKVGVLGQWLGDLADEMDVRATYNLPLNAKFLVRQGIGSAFTCRGLFEANELNDLAFVPLSPTLESTQGLVWRKTLPTRQAQAFLDTLKGLCAERDFENPPADAS